MSQDKLILQILREEDLPEIIKTFNFPWTSLEATKEKWERYYETRHASVNTLKEYSSEKNNYKTNALNSISLLIIPSSLEMILH